MIASIKNNGLLARFAPEVHAEDIAKAGEQKKDGDEWSEQCCKKDLKELEKVRDEYKKNEAYTKGGLLIQCYINDSFLKVGNNDNLYCPSNKDFCEVQITAKKDGEGKCYFDMSKYDEKLFGYYKEAWNDCTKLCIEECKGDQSCIENKCFNNGERCKDSYKNYNNYLKNPEFDEEDWYKKYHEIDEKLDDVEKCIKYQKGGKCDGNGGSSLSYKEIVKKLGKNKGEYYIYAY